MGLRDRRDAGLSECFLYGFPVPGSARLPVLRTSPTVCCVCQHPRTACFPLITTPASLLCPKSLKAFTAAWSFSPPTENYFRAESSHTDCGIWLIRPASHPWQSPRSSPGDGHVPLPGIYPAHNVTEPTLVPLVTVPHPLPPAAGDFGQDLGIFFFFQIETNLALLRLEVDISLSLVWVENPQPPPWTGDSFLSIPWGLSFSLFF